ncbi:MAG TPA: DUF2723 domain-containing protein [Clostridiales bacterium]|jgi:hypothetical protein|nr:DUF2723 domain-containing protein [Clostridiales bacterium]HQP69732.1 DUF2723 domain-containing protein [Clostridiales bacterium]
MITNEKKVTRFTGAAVLLLSLVVYLMTVADTTSFWDCGEFITTSYILGIPHPPGAPFYLMLGRLFSMMPFGDDIGYRVNLISVFSSAVTVLLLYLISARLIRNWRGAAIDNYDLFIIHASSAIGALTFAFTYTFWFNAVEAEVYALSMFFTAIIIWLTLVWTEKHNEPDSAKYLLIMMLLVGLGTGVHLLNILTLPVAVFIMWYYDRRTAMIVGAGVFISILVLFAVPLDWKIYSLFIFFILIIIFRRMENNEDISLVFIMPLLLILGYSTYLMIFLRAGLNPPINENDPSNWTRMLAYLNREQYGDEEQLKNAVTLFFGNPNRKYLESLEKIGAVAGSSDDPWKGHWAFFWKYQIVDMYIRYFNWQFIGMNINKINSVVTLDGLYAVPFLAGLWGALHHFFKDWKKAAALMALFVIMSLGLVIYQNQDFMQPRERDYFYVGSFFIFSIWIGFGVASILETLKENRIYAKLIMPVAIIALIIPVMELKANYFITDRTGNFVAWDYSKNILESCDENGILFTNGDNDTFPVWYLQEVEGIRKDVQVVNLSLLNTGWYIKQLKEKMPDYIRYTDQQIAEYFDQHLMTSEGFMRRYWPQERSLQLSAKDNKGIIEWKLGPTMKIPVQNKAEGFLKIQDQMVLEIVAYNAQMNWKRPVYFAVTVGSSNFIGLDEWMRMDGLCFRVVDYKADKGIEPPVVYDRILGRYLTAYRNLNDPGIFYDDNIQRLVQNYRSAFLQLALYYDELEVNPESEANDPALDFMKNYTFDEFNDFSINDKKKYLLLKMEEFIPAKVIPITNEMVVAELAGMYADINETEKGLELLKSIDIKSMSLNKKLRFLLHSSSRGYKEYGSSILFQILTEIEALPESRSKYEKYLEMYAGFSKLNEPEMKQLIFEKTVVKLASVQNIELRNSMFKEFAVLCYQSGDKQNSVTALNKYIEINRTDLEAVDLLCQIHTMSADYDKALEMVNVFLSIKPGDEEYTAMKAELEMKKAGAGLSVEK